MEKMSTIKSVTMQKENLNGLNGLFFFDLGVKCDPSFDQLCEIHPNSTDLLL